MYSPTHIGDPWLGNFFFPDVEWKHLDELAAQLGCGTTAVYFVSGQIEMEMQQGQRAKPQVGDWAEFRRLLMAELTPQRVQTIKNSKMAGVAEDLFGSSS